MYACMCVCIYVCMHVRTYVRKQENSVSRISEQNTTRLVQKIRYEQKQREIYTEIQHALLQLHSISLFIIAKRKYVLVQQGQSSSALQMT